MFLSLVHFDTLSVEATARKAPNGDLIVVCTCGGVREPAPENRVYLFRSKDGGRTWSPKEILNEEDGFAHYQTCTAVTDDEIWVFISRHNGYFVDWQNYLLVSKDSGFTWERREFGALPKYGFVRSMVALSNGQLLFPYHYYPVTEEQADECRAKNVMIIESRVPYIEGGIIVSSDGGKNFERRVAFLQEGDDIPTCGGGKWRWSWSENTVVELGTPGHLAMVYRVENSGFLWRCDSHDFGKTWENPYKTDIPNPNNKPQLLKGKGGEIILVNTPNNKEGIFYLRKRFPLEVWVSADDMRTWGKKIRVSDFPGAYSYADGFIDDDGHLKLAFEFNRHDVYFADIDI